MPCRLFIVLTKEAKGLGFKHRVRGGKNDQVWKRVAGG